MKCYGKVPDSIEAPPGEEQRADLVWNRLTGRRRAALFKSVSKARKEFKAFKIRPATPAEIMRKVFA